MYKMSYYYLKIASPAIESSLNMQETEHHSSKGTAIAKCRMVLRQLSYKRTLQPAFPSFYLFLYFFSSFFRKSPCF